MIIAALVGHLAALEYGGWRLPLPDAAAWQVSPQAPNVPGVRYQRADPPATVVLARQPVDGDPAVVAEGQIAAWLTEPSVELLGREENEIEGLPAVLLQWRLEVAGQLMWQTAVLVPDQSALVVGVVSSEEPVAQHKKLLLMLQRVID